MTRTLVAILALSPAMLFAQATLPAQPVSTPVLLAGLAVPAASSPADPTKASSTPVRITSGVIPPALLTKPTPDDGSADSVPAALMLKRTVVIDLIVDAKGKPTNLTVAQSCSDHYLDADAIKAVSALRFKPATLDGQPTAISMRLNYVMQHVLYN